MCANIRAFLYKKSVYDIKLTFHDCWNKILKKFAKKKFYCIQFSTSDTLKKALPNVLLFYFKINKKCFLVHLKIFSQKRLDTIK